MSPREKDKFICQHPDINIGWHEPGETFYSGSHSFLNNPDFTSEAGRVQLLKLAYQKSQWRPNRLTALQLMDDDGAFRDEIYEWLGGVE